MPVGETDAILGQLIDMGRTNVFGSLIAKVRPTEIINKKENNIGLSSGSLKSTKGEEKKKK